MQPQDEPKTSKMSRNALQQVAKAITELDKASFSRPSKGTDADDWIKARSLLWEIMKRNGYELSKPGSSRIKKTK